MSRLIFIKQYILLICEYLTSAVRSDFLVSSNGTLDQPTLAQIIGYMAKDLALVLDSNTSNTTEGEFGICQHMQHMT